MNVTPAPTGLTFAALVERVEATGLTASAEGAAGWTAVRADAGDDADRLGRLLIERGLFTPFQWEQLIAHGAASLRIGNYDLLERLGAGGMGAVYKARHRRMKRVVALKVMAARLSQNPLFVKRFQREVETIASLGHPNVVMAYDADEAEAGHFLVMEFVDGLDLAACVARHGPLPVPLAVDCMLQAARGLAYAHDRDLVHRDVKPHNLLLDVHGTVKVADLGLARLQHASDAEADAVTSAGGVLGTVEYMSPEQALDSTTIDGRADVYSLGCTLHFLLTGRAPYRGDSIMSVLLQHRSAAVPSLTAARPDVPAALDDLFQRMMAKDAARRTAGMADAAAELEQIARTLPAVAGGAGGGGPAGAETAELTGRAADGTVGIAPGATVALPAEAAAQASPAAARVAPSATTSALPPDATVELAALDPAAIQIAAASAPAERSEPSDGVLIVEPSRVQASIMKGIVEQAGLRAVGAVMKAAEAFETIVGSTRSAGAKPGAVVAALHLADFSGVELARRARERLGANAPNFVIVTSSTDDAGGAQALPAGTVWLAKPFDAPKLQAALREAGRRSESSLSDSSSKGRRAVRVLIVDDSSTARMRVRTVLQAAGFSDFVEVPDGADAIAAAAREPFQLIVTDYNMPLMDGRALVSYLKQHRATSAIPIVMTTTESDEAKLAEVRRLGVVAIVEKGFSPDVVEPLLRTLFP